MISQDISLHHQAIVAAASEAVSIGWSRRGQAHLADLRKTAKLRIGVEGASYLVTVEVVPDEPGWESADIDIPEAVTRPRQSVKLLEDTFSRSPIAGRIVSVLAAIGQQVEKNCPVLIIEAMKMEIEISAAVDGVIKTIHVKPGESVSTGQLLFELA